MLKKVLAVIRDEEGATMVEYALLVALIAVALIGAVTALRGGVSNTYGKATTELNK